MVCAIVISMNRAFKSGPFCSRLDLDYSLWSSAIIDYGANATKVQIDLRMNMAPGQASRPRRHFRTRFQGSFLLIAQAQSTTSYLNHNKFDFLRIVMLADNYRVQLVA